MESPEPNPHHNAATPTLGDEDGGGMGAEDDVERYRRRLAKALALADKFKSKYLFELEVNKELGRRNEELRSSHVHLQEEATVEKDRARAHRTAHRELSKKHDELRAELGKERAQRTELVHEVTSLRQQLETLRCSFNQLLKKVPPSSPLRKHNNGSSGSGAADADGAAAANQPLPIAPASSVAGAAESEPSPQTLLGPRALPPLFDHFFVVGTRPVSLADDSSSTVSNAY